MDMVISGSGTIGAGEYERIRISGSGKADGLVRCKSFHCSGAFSGSAVIECENEIHVSGAFKNTGEIKAKEFSASGSAKNNAALTADVVKVSGGFKVGGKLKAVELRVSGGLGVDGDIEAENARITGGVSCAGLINAEEFYLDTSGSNYSHAESVGGSRITVENRRTKGFLEKLFGSRNGYFEVRESIEGDEISLENTRVKTVTGRNVIIGEGCRIDLVRYTESVDVHPDAKVGKLEKI
ncbi:MAG: hypothetical protein IJ017_05010 [Oscillospiraceae bacterium]|nr:hypothetical protein [Oscillospiraceae bacterium]